MRHRGRALVAAVAMGALASCSSSASTTAPRSDASTALLARPATTTTAVPAHGTLTVSPSAGRSGAMVVATGDGCLQPDATVGLSHGLQYFDPSGAALGGDRGEVAPDGTWSEPLRMGPTGVTGRYRIHAQCLDASRHVLFDYQDAYYDATG